jgi:hypothetical protein
MDAVTAGSTDAVEHEIVAASFGNRVDGCRQSLID